MHIKHLTFTLLALLFTVACDGDVDSPDFDERQVGDPAGEPIRTGQTWGPCDLTNVDDPSWWGCDGELGSGDACLRPVSDLALSVCVPQTWDPQVDADCGNVEAPFGLGVSVGGSAYCVADCETDADCGDGMACSPASHFCAWVGE